MEAFSFLKYWKGGAALTLTPTSPTLPLSDIQTHQDDTDDGPFFDLEFTLPDDSEDANENLNDDLGDDDINNNDNDDSESESESESEFKFTISPSNSSNDPNLSPSPSHSEPNSKPHLTASFFKSATKFRVFMLGLKKSKPNVVSDKEPNASDSQPKKSQQRKLFTVKFKVEEAPILSFFTRDNSSKGKPSQNTQESQSQTETLSLSSASDENRLMRKYFKMVKPLYVKVSRRFSEQLNASTPESDKAETPQPESSPAKGVAEKPQTEAESSETAGTNGKGQKQGNIPLPAGLRVVCKHLGKSRSASSSAATPTPAAAALVSSRRRDDSLLQQQDGIQGAILHCKRSFNASRDTECESSELAGCVSDSLQDISPELSRNSTNEG
ncbi:probable membrane-associated kinase regulator 2 [Abrus precatorius]|uniref:Probable membrane-associated kinase regulator 2 n=1 Tax=Abrus precatorius TaxID=3816 RepID=A0A8B8KH89_ABRPR|nr:probable membrane-associated kinase regulator 2 [Abrus precatorius]